MWAVCIHTTGTLAQAQSRNTLQTVLNSDAKRHAIIVTVHGTCVKLSAVLYPARRPMYLNSSAFSTTLQGASPTPVYSHGSTTGPREHSATAMPIGLYLLQQAPQHYSINSGHSSKQNQFLLCVLVFVICNYIYIYIFIYI